MKTQDEKNKEAVAEVLKLMHKNKGDAKFRQTFAKNILSKDGFEEFLKLFELHIIAKTFLIENKVSCAEATVDDKVYANAPELIEKIGNLIGYYKYDDENEDE